MDGRRVAFRELPVAAGLVAVGDLASIAPPGSGGVFVAHATLAGRTMAIGLVAGWGSAGSPGALSVTNQEALTKHVASRAADAGTWTLSLRRTGYLGRNLSVASLAEDLGPIELLRDPIEDRIDSTMATMDIDDKLGQMTQGVIGTGSKDLGRLKLGSLLSGGGDPFPDYAALQAVSLATPRRLPMIYGIDAVHGNAKLDGATVFPHHIGLGATRDSSLVRRIGEATAQEMIASGTDWAFSPCIAVPQDDRWGRTYEGFGETPELAAMMGAAEVRGLQGVSAPWTVLACAKHFVADGGTTFGTGTQKTSLDQGDARITEDELRRIHLPGYRAAVRAGVGTVMASYSLVNGVRDHANKHLLTDVLKTELGFDGFVVSDYLAIEQISPDTSDFRSSVKAAINAGVDMGMEPNRHALFISTLKALVNDGSVPASRIDDAVRRILRIKYRLGRMDSPYLPVFVASPVGSSDHRSLAREAVRKSLVVLKNEAVDGRSALPIAPSSKIAVHGSHADDAGLQCGGWTLGWQGAAGAVKGATTILQGMKSVMPSAQIVAGTAKVAGADEAVFVLGEKPYAEMKGDLTEAAFADFIPDAATTTLMNAYRAAKIPVVTIFVTGRPRPVPSLLAASDAFVVAWFPGSEGAGVADVLSGACAPVGKLPETWPASGSDEPINTGDGKIGAFPFGFGLTW
jgi:beta-glucosidase